MAKTRIHIICNTHWDREHRHNFQQTRMMLVDLIDQLIELFEKEKDFHTFILDGQSVVLEDYLEVKPGNRAKLEELVREGRLQVGPWYTLPDHTPSNPESILRNLMLGEKVSREFGKRMDIGFSIFSFGQPGQLPQIYSNFGIDRLIFYKGAPLKKIEKNEFWWQAPDGTRALSSKLGDWFRCNFFVYFSVPVLLGGDMAGYGQWKCSFDESRKLTAGADPEGVKQFAAELQPDIRIRRNLISKATEDVLHSVRNSNSANVKVAFDGIDFSTPAPGLTEAIRLANKSSRRIEMVQSDLEKYFDEFLADVDTSSLQVFEGEMRTGPIGGVHSETLSTNTPIKQGVAAVENALLCQIEPFATFISPYGYAYPEAFTELAWKYIFKIEAHDSMHGAGDQALRANSMHMVSQAEDIAAALRKRVFESIILEINSRSAPEGKGLVTLFNPLPYVFSGVQRLTVNVPEEAHARKIVFTDMDGKRLESYVYERHEKIIGSVNPENRPKALPVQRFIADVMVENIPPMGYKTLLVEYDTHPYPEEDLFGYPFFPYAPVVAPDGTMCNGLLTVRVNPDCTVSVTDHTTGHTIPRTHILRDTGDAGNVWVHVPPTWNQTVMPLSPGASVRILENSALCGVVEVRYALRVPQTIGCDGKRRSDEDADMEVSTRITLLKGERTIRFKTTVENCARDHKLSVCFPSGVRTEHSYSDGIFEIVRRSVNYRTDNDGITGDELLRHPMQRFVDMSDGKKGAAVMSKGIHEFETYDIQGDAAVDLTLLRSVSQRFPIHSDVFVDFDRHPSQSQGEQEFEYALYLHEGDYMEGRVQTEAARYVVSNPAYQHARGETKGALPLSGYSFLSKSNDAVALHCVKPAENGRGIIVRLCNATGVRQQERITFHRPVTGAFTCRADERMPEPLAAKGNSVDLEIEPYRIVTLNLIFKS